jgi:hypothetical protein
MPELTESSQNIPSGRPWRGPRCATASSLATARPSPRPRCCRMVQRIAPCLAQLGQLWSVPTPGYAETGLRALEYAHPQAMARYGLPG